MIPHGVIPFSARPIFSELVPDFDALGDLPLPSAHTILFVAADARSVPADTIARAAKRLLSAGVIWICVWGPDCERVHDVFDEAHIGDGSIEPPFTLMSTWHADETLEEALWFFVSSAFPLDTEIETTAYVAVAVGHAEWAAVIEHALSDLAALSARVVGSD